jgi:glycine oxidase
VTGASSAEVVIVGGGVIGCATAYFLAAEHPVPSIIIERNAIGAEASGGAAGELAAAELAEVGGHRPSESYTRLLQAGIALHSSLSPTLLEESGVDYMLADLPMLRPAFNETEVAHLQAQAEQHRAFGIGGEWVEPETLRAMGPWLSDEAIGAIYSTELQLEAYPFALALAQAAEVHGVEIRTGEVTGIQWSGTRAAGVRMGANTLSAQSVVIANGPWAQHAGEWIGIDIPVKPLRGQIVHLDLPPGSSPPRQAIFHETGYVLPKPNGDLLVGTTMEDVGFDREPTQGARDAILEAAMRLAPALIDAPVRDVTACLRPYSLDDRPLMGAVPGKDGLYLATGHGFKGITLCLITGKIMAQLIAQGQTSFPLDELTPARLVTE